MICVNWKKFALAEDAWPLWDLIAVLTLPKIVRLKAVVDGKMAGFIAGDPHPHEKLGWIATLGVLPTVPAPGNCGSPAVSMRGRTATLPRIRLSVRRSNEPAMALYKKSATRW